MGAGRGKGEALGHTSKLDRQTDTQSSCYFYTRIITYLKKSGEGEGTDPQAYFQTPGTWWCYCYYYDGDGAPLDLTESFGVVVLPLLGCPERCCAGGNHFLKFTRLL